MIFLLHVLVWSNTFIFNSKLILALNISLPVPFQIAAAQTVSFTSDIWTDDNSTNAFISLTGHFIDPDTMQCQNITLATRSFQDHHNASNICDILDDMIDEWKLTSKIHVLVHDNAANMVAGVRVSKLLTYLDKN